MPILFDDGEVTLPVLSPSLESIVARAFAPRARRASVDAALAERRLGVVRSSKPNEHEAPRRGLRGAS